MAEIEELKNYLKKMQRTVNSPDFNMFGYSIIKNTKVDDLLCCIIAVLPDLYKKALKKRLPLNTYPSVASYNRFSKIIKKTFFLSKDYYIFKSNEANTLIMNILKNIDNDIKNLEEEENK